MLVINKKKNHQILVYLQYTNNYYPKKRSKMSAILIIELQFLILLKTVENVIASL